MDESRDKEEEVRILLENDTKEDDAPQEADCISLEYDLFEDVASKLDEFVRLNHVKKFVEAEGLYQSDLVNHQDWFPVVAEFAEHLLLRGFYEELANFSKEKLKAATEPCELQVLILMGVIAGIHQKKNFQEARAQISVIWHFSPIDYSKTMPIDTEIHILELLLQATVLIERYRGPMLVNIDSLPQLLRETRWEYFITWSHHLFDNGYYWEAHRIFRWLLKVLPLSEAKDLLKGNLEAVRHMQTRNEALEIAISASLQVFMQHLDGLGNPDVSKWNDFVTRMAFGHFQPLFESDYRVMKQLQETIGCPLPLIRNQEDEAESSQSSTYETQSSVDQTEAWDPSRRNFDATFRKAAKEGDVPLMKSLLEKGADLESEDLFQQRPLHLAAANGHIEIIRIMVDRGVKIGYEDWFQRMPIYLAAKNGHDSVLQPLLHENTGDNLEAHGVWNKALRCAVENGYEAVVRVLLASGANATIDPDTLILAVRRGHRQMVKMLLKVNDTLDISTRDTWGWTPLMSAVDEGHDAIIEILKEKGARERPSQPDYDDGNNETPLLYAIKQRHDALVSVLLRQEGLKPKSESDQNQPSPATTSAYEKIAKPLLEHRDIEINAQDKEGRTALSYAAENENENTVKALLAHKDIEVNIQDREGRTALSYAAGNDGRKDIMELLLKHGANVNAQGGYYGNALQAAVFGGHEKIVEMLLKHGADVNAQGGYYGNALQTATSRDNEKIVEMLLKHGADVNAQGGYYENALQATTSRDNEKIVKMLLKHGADVNAQGGYYENALQAATSRDNEKIVEMLLKHGADVNAQGGYYENALQAATSRDNEKIVEMLLKHGADVNAQGGSYENALQAATSRDNEKIVEMLLKHGADVNAQGGYYGNALQTATSRDNEKIVEMLLKHGADVNAQGGYYGNALQAAASRGRKEIMEMLLEHGADINEADINVKGGLNDHALQAGEDGTGDGMGYWMGKRKKGEMKMEESERENKKGKEGGKKGERE